MPRPRKRRRICFNPDVLYYKPRGVPLRALKEVVLSHDEIEALRLKHIENLDQIESAKQMQISQSTFHRILNNAYRKVSNGIIKGMAIRIEL
jgi:predicted DNA-binding protein (UPF0251 family)